MAEGEEERRREPIFRDKRQHFCKFCGICRSKKSQIAVHMFSDHQKEMERQEMEAGVESERRKCDNTCEVCAARFKKPAHLKEHLSGHSLECVKHWIPKNSKMQGGFVNVVYLDWTSIRMENLLRSSIKFCFDMIVCEALDPKELQNARRLYILNLEWTSIRLEYPPEKLYQRPFVCPVEGCASSFRRRYHFDRHALTHQGKLFKCPMEGCKKEFNVQSNMKRHLKKIHEGKHVKEQKKYVCQEIGCGKEFKFPSRLRSHEESHVNKFDSSEAFCGDPSCMKPFANIKCLRAHTRSCHQYISCEVCGSKQLKKNIKRHLRTHEERSMEPMKCSFKGCDLSFTTKSNLRQHVKAVHLQLRPFICGFPGCGMRFSYKHVRDNHEKSGHHVYVHGDLEEFDEQFISRPRGGRKRSYPNIETLVRKRVTPPNQGDPVNGSVDYISWLLSTDPDE